MITHMWNFFEPNNSQWYYWKLDGASLWMYKNGEEWRFALKPLPFKHLQSDAGGPYPASPPVGIPVSLAVSAGKRAALRPHPSPLPYLISARNEVTILPGSEAWFTIALPPVLKLELDTGHVLFEGQPFTTSTTWFGDKTSGSLCLSLPIELDPECKNERSSPDNAEHRAAQYLACKSLIHCKIVVKNKSKEPLDVERLAIFTDLMNLYEERGTLVSDTVVITGTADGALQTNIEDAGSRGLQKIHSAAKTGLNEVLIRRGVSFLRSITGL
jgi:hypothetical protein